MHSLIIFLVVIFAVIICCHNTEGFASVDDASNEAVQNIAGVYNDENMSISNLTVTGITNLKGGSDNSQGGTHLPYSDGNNYISANENYIRGNAHVTSGGGDLKITNGWTGSPDGNVKNSEIANDIGGYKKLMVVGNKSGGGSRRVGVWDELHVHGTLTSDNTRIKDHRWGPSSARSTTHPNWTEYSCGDNEVMCGLRFTHHGGQDYAYQETCQIKCCKVG